MAEHVGRFLGLMSRVCRKGRRARIRVSQETARKKWTTTQQTWQTIQSSFFVSWVQERQLCI
eukprot:766457-Hanusia_phi.AAC.10